MRILGPGIQRRAYCLGLLPRALPRQKVFGEGEHFLWSSQHILGGEVLHLNERWAFLLVFNLGETLGFCGSFGQRASMHELTTPGRHSFLRLLAEILCGTLPLPLPPCALGLRLSACFGLSWVRGLARKLTLVLVLDRYQLISLISFSPRLPTGGQADKKARVLSPSVWVGDEKHTRGATM